MEASTERPTFLQHYISYLFSNSGIISIFILFAIMLYAWTERQSPEGTPSNIPGCIRFGLQGRSNLDRIQDPQIGTLPEDQEPRVQALFTYPIKSCRGVELSGSEVTGLGLKYDRTFSFAQLVKTSVDSKSGVENEYSAAHQWRFITQRERPQMAQITTELWIPDPRVHSDDEDSASDSEATGLEKINDWTANGGCLVVHFPHTRSMFGMRLYTETLTLNLPLNPTSQRVQARGYTLESFSIWKDRPLALNVTQEINSSSLAKLKHFLGISNPISLFRVDDTKNLRTITRSLPKDRPNNIFNVGFGDAFPLSLLNLASVQDIDACLPTTSNLKHNLDPRRFRANIYISGPAPFAEDSWKRIHLGLSQGFDAVEQGEYHIACRTARCTLPNVDPISGVRDKKEPFDTLKRTRVVDEGAKPHSSLGMSVLPLFEKGIIRVGERVEVLQEGIHVYEKMFQ